MIIIIAGSRDFNDYDLLKEEAKTFIKSHRSYNLFEDHKSFTEEVLVISGTAKGADKLGERFAEDLGYDIQRMPAQWEDYGKSAGHRRNAEMASVASHALIFWDGKSKGTEGMIEEAKKKFLTYKVVHV